MKWEVRGLAAVSLLGTSTTFTSSVSGKERKKRGQEVRDRLNGSLLINFRFFSRPLDTWRYAIHKWNGQRISHSSTGPNMSEWGERYLNDSMSSSISLPFLVHIYCSGWKYWRGERSYTARPMLSRMFRLRSEEKETSIRYVGGGRRFQNTFQIARLTNSLFPPARRRCEERRINTQPGRASCFFLLYCAT